MHQHMLLAWPLHVRFDSLERVFANSQTSAQELSTFLQEQRVEWKCGPEWLRIVSLADGVSKPVLASPT